jgi:hypothetical protein
LRKKTKKTINTFFLPGKIIVSHEQKTYKDYKKAVIEVYVLFLNLMKQENAAVSAEDIESDKASLPESFLRRLDVGVMVRLRYLAEISQLMSDNPGAGDRMKFGNALISAMNTLFNKGEDSIIPTLEGHVYTSDSWSMPLETYADWQIFFSEVIEAQERIANRSK